MSTKAARTKLSSKIFLEAVRAFCARKGFVSEISKEAGIPEVYGQLGSELKRNIQDAWSANIIINHVVLSVVHASCVRWQNVVTSRGNVWGVETGLLLNKVQCTCGQLKVSWHAQLTVVVFVPWFARPTLTVRF